MRFLGPPSGSQIQKTPIYSKECPIGIELPEKERNECLFIRLDAKIRVICLEFYMH